MFEEGSRELAGSSVLVVDDQPDARELLDEFLATFGMRVAQAASGREAFEQFSEQRPDIIVSDIEMPDGNGLELIRRIRELSPDRGGLTPAISVSGGSSSEESLEAGFHYHFAKPIDPLVLLDAVRDFVRANKTHRAKWTVQRNGDDIVHRIDGHMTAADMTALVSAIAALLEQAERPLRVIADIRRLTGIDPSVGAVAQTSIWHLRHKIDGVVCVGGSTLARLVTRSCCVILGVKCEIVDDGRL